MRILHYNILEGCREDPERLHRLLGWIGGQGADVVGLAELNGWDKPPTMAARAAACGFAHSHLFVRRSEYLIGLMARQPIEVIEELSEGLHHGILHATIGDVHYLYTHFSPHQRVMRIHEARTCAGIAGGISGPLVLMGDLNSHSPRDRVTCEALCTAENREWAMDFEPQQILLDAGLTDIIPGNDPLGSLSMAFHPNGHKRRLDFIYVNAAFKARHPGVGARVLHATELATLSDHYPVICDTDGANLA